MSVPQDFYETFAPIALTAFGLWLVVVQVRHADWMRHPARRRRAYGVSLYFVLPGAMSLLSLVEPGNEALWRVSFGVLGLIGAIAGPLSDRGWLGWVSAVLYAGVVVVAAAPDLPGDVFDLNALRAESLLLTLIVVLGLNVAWLLLFEEDEKAELSEPADARPADPGP